jgi:hypothetical protein
MRHYTSVSYILGPSFVAGCFPRSDSGKGYTPQCNQRKQDVRFLRGFHNSLRYFEGKIVQ